MTPILLSDKLKLNFKPQKVNKIIVYDWALELRSKLIYTYGEIKFKMSCSEYAVEVYRLQNIINHQSVCLNTEKTDKIDSTGECRWKRIVTVEVMYILQHWLDKLDHLCWSNSTKTD